MSGDRDRSDKVKVNNQVRHVPKDAQVVMSILKELGVRDYEQRVINQILEFAYRKIFTSTEIKRRRRYSLS